MTRILIIDDEPITRQTLADLLAAEDYTLEFAVDGPSGIEQAKANPPDIILLDVMLPKMDGFTVCTHLRTDRALAEIPILMITAYSERSMRLRGIAAGADDFIAKPFDGMELIVRLRTLARLDRYRRLNAERERFRWVMDRSSVGYVLLDTTGAVEHVNAPALLFLGLNGSAAPPPTTIRSLLTAAFRLEPAELWTQWPKRPLTGEAYLVRPETPTAPAFWLSASEQRTTHGEATQILLKLVDVTDSITNATDMRSFRTVMAHKLRTPMNAIVGMLALLQELPDRETLGSVRDLIADAHGGALRLNAAVTDVLGYIEGISTRTTPDGIPAAALSAIAETACAMAGAPSVAVEIDESALPYLLPLSPHALEQVLFELVENGRKFSPHETPAITISLAADKTALILAVADDGQTLAPQQVRWAMTPYLQGEKHFTGETPGMGLGLSLVSALVWRSGGSVNLHNRHDAPGVVVDLRFPLA